MKRRLQLDIAGTPGARKPWRDVVERAVRQAWDEPPMDAGPLRFSVEFWLAGPEGAPLWATGRPPIGPMVDATLAGVIAAGVIADPHKLVDSWATKLTAPGPWTGARILVAELS